VYALQHTGYFDKDGTEIAYATDPQYVESITRIINQYNLKQYDLTKEDIRMLEDLEKRVAALEKLVAQQNTNTEPVKQTISPWAKEGYEFVTAKKGDLSISDGSRPKDPVTREELWTSLQRANTIYNTK
jgi:antitoxin component HigA of HigAB toxin-antitoxin module